MTTKKMIGISLMVALAGVFIVWNLRDGGVNATLQMLVSGALAGGMFAAWRFLVWQGPRR